MRIIVEADVFTDENVNELHKNILFHYGFEGRCHILIWPSYIPTAPDDTHPIQIWLNSLNDRHRKECIVALQDGIAEEMRRPSARTIRVRANTNTNWMQPEPILSLSDLIDFLQRPFRVLLENKRNDGAFLLAIADEDDRNWLVFMKDKHWVEFEHMGGLGEMLVEIRNIKNHRRDTFNVWVLFDSDRLQPGQSSPDSERILNECGVSVPCHQLSRRSIENYLPIEVLGAWARHTSHIITTTTLRALNRDQRNFYNMKSGFSGDQHRHNITAGTLYDGLSPHVRNNLNHGFGANIASLFQRSDYWFRAWYAADGQLRETDPMIRHLLALL